MEKLSWHEWTAGREVPVDVPMEEWLLVEVDSKVNRFETVLFRRLPDGRPYGVVGGRFYFDAGILRWASIAHLVPGVSS